MKKLIAFINFLVACWFLIKSFSYNGTQFSILFIICVLWAIVGAYNIYLLRKT